MTQATHLETHFQAYQEAEVRLKELRRLERLARKERKECLDRLLLYIQTHVKSLVVIDMQEHSRLLELKRQVESIVQQA